MKTYTPGLFWTKLVIFLIFLAVTIAGFVDMWPPIRLLISGKVVDSIVIRVVKTKPGFPAENYTTTQPIAEDRNRSAKFWHYVEFLTVDRKTVNAKINIASQLNPTYKVGERVTVAYDPARPESAIAILDLKTWTMGSFIFGTGFCFALTFFFFTLYARKPIEVPEDTVVDKDIKVA